ncbi:MAG TPA: gamma-glutamyltransferase family protein [Candidatus Binataceae bacterium]|nr:gamma-glutamyltransferase family protein [Candidatus Binataceae bacterium]
MSTLYPLIVGREAVLSTEHYLSAAAGARIFERGGNAIDAAIAAALVEGVVNPHMHTIGGEAPMLLRVAGSGRVVAINGNTMAPARATIAQYRSLGLDLVPGEGLLAAGVPAAFGAFACVLENFGTMALRDVAVPALALCEDGFAMHPGLCGDDRLIDVPGLGLGSIHSNAELFRTQFPSTARLYMPHGELPRSGDVIRNPSLAGVFRRLLDAEAGAHKSGREAGLRAAVERFYRGDIAREIVAHSDAHGGLLTLADLAAFTTRIEEPVSRAYRGATVFKCGPWTQGPVFLQQLALLEGFDLAAMGHNSAAYLHTLLEAAKLAFADREAYYADPEFTEVPLRELLSDSYAALRRKLIDPRSASMELRPGDPRAMRAAAGEPVAARPWGAGTTHVDAADRHGNLIAITPSGAWLRSSPVADALGFPLGTRLQTFYLDERHPNALAPRKRPRTTLTPSMALLRDGRWFAFGTQGGDQQDQWTLQFFLNLVEFGMNPQAAIESPRYSMLHAPSSFYPHDAHPGLVRIESRVDREVRDELAARGHQVEERPPWCDGNVLAVALDGARGTLAAGADPRGQIASLMPAQAVGW